MEQAADLAADVAAHCAVILAARERQEAVRDLAALSAKAEEATVQTQQTAPMAREGNAGTAEAHCCRQQQVTNANLQLKLAEAHDEIVQLRAQLEFAKKITQLQEQYKGAADAVGPGGLTPLLLACMQGKIDDVTALLALGADPAREGDVYSTPGDGPDPDRKHKCAPLMLAARDGHMEIVSVLLAHERADANQGSSDGGCTALGFACFSGCTLVVKLLLAHDGIDANQARTNKGLTPLFMACYNGHADIVELLLAHDGIDANQARTNNGVTPLFVACSNGHTAIVKLLLAHDGIDANQAAMDDGETPLFMACYNGHADIVELLLAHDGIDANQATTHSGGTPLFVACLEGHAEIVTLLLVHDGIDANQARTDYGGTPLYMACQNGHTAVVKLLLAHDGIDANQAATDAGFTPLYMACYKGHAEIVTLLLAHDEIDANQTTMDNGETPLFMACQKGHAAIVKLMLAHDGIDANHAATHNGATPLHAAAFGGAISSSVLLVMQYLVVYGASLVAETFDGRTPAQLATLLNKPTLAEWLNAVSGWSQLRVAAGCRLYKDATFLLRWGKIDPDDPATTSIDDIMAVVAASTAKPAELLWQNAPAICRVTTTLVVDATRGWHRTTHWLHHKAVRDAVVAVLVVAGRLQEKGALPAEASADTRTSADTVNACAPVPLLPIEVWFFAMRFFKRSWWEVGASNPA